MYSRNSPSFKHPWQPCHRAIQSALQIRSIKPIQSHCRIWNFYRRVISATYRSLSRMATNKSWHRSMPKISCSCRNKWQRWTGNKVGYSHRRNARWWFLLCDFEWFWRAIAYIGILFNFDSGTIDIRFWYADIAVTGPNTIRSNAITERKLYIHG